MNETLNQPPEFNEDELRMPEGTFKTVETEHHGKLGLILGLLIVALVLILAGLYLWYTNVFQQAASLEPAEQTRTVPEMPNDPETANADAAVQQFDTVSPANDLNSIIADTESTNLETIDTELSAIDAELGVTPEEIPKTTAKPVTTEEESTDTQATTTNAVPESKTETETEAAESATSSNAATTVE